jgi:hypothetical protein
MVTLSVFMRKFDHKLMKVGGTLQRTIPKIGNKHSQFSHSFVSELFIYSHDRSAYSTTGYMWTDLGNMQIAHRHMIVEVGTGAKQFPEKEYINGISVAVQGA